MPKRKSTRARKKRTQKSRGPKSPGKVSDDVFSALAAEIDKPQRTSSAPKKTRKNSHLGHRTHILFYVVFGIMLVTIIGLVAWLLIAFNQFEKHQATALEAFELLKQDRDRYREAYEIVLEDAQAFGRIHDITYEGEGEQEILPNASDEVDAWSFYNDRGFIDDSCIATTKLVETPDELVIMTLVVERPSVTAVPARLTLLVDAREADRFEIGASGRYGSALTLTPGTHRLDFVYDNAEASGGLSVKNVLLGDRAIDTSLTIFDAGTGFEVFDCENTTIGSVLDRDGAMRFRIEKV